jgi:hypothetical protein
MLPTGRTLKIDNTEREILWRVADDLDYLVTLARLRIGDALAGPLPETPADRQRKGDLERIERAFPLNSEEPGAVIPPSGGSSPEW